MFGLGGTLAVLLLGILLATLCDTGSGGWISMECCSLVLAIQGVMTSLIHCKNIEESALFLWYESL